MESKIKIGVIREGKNPPDKRVPLTPKQCVMVETLYPNVEVFVQSSQVRAFKDQEYSDLGIPIVENVEECDILIGVKEVNIEDLIPHKKYLFFSHTFKKQEYNRELLKAILDKKIQLIDYETLRGNDGKRIIGFGRYAGIVGCYNGFLTYGLKHDLYQIKPANECRDRKEVEEELKKVKLPSNMKVVLTGYGRVGHGAREIIEQLPITEVTPDEFLKNEFDKPVFTHLDVDEYYEKRDGGEFNKNEFYKQPTLYKSVFRKFLSETDMYIPCHYWSDKADYIMTREDLKDKNVRLSVVADISCDIDGPIPCTLRPSKIGDAIYGYSPNEESEVDYKNEDAIAVMAVDNLPCELPLDASEDFGNELIKEVFPSLLVEDKDGIIERGSETNLDGQLTEYFKYLEDYVAGLA